MSLSELYPNVKQLGRADKLRLMQWLIVELAREEGISLFAPDVEYPVWTPLDASDAGETLLRMRKEGGSVQ